MSPTYSQIIQKNKRVSGGQKILRYYKVINRYAVCLSVVLNFHGLNK